MRGRQGAMALRDAFIRRAVVQFILHTHIEQRARAALFWTWFSRSWRGHTVVCGCIVCRITASLLLLCVYVVFFCFVLESMFGCSSLSARVFASARHLRIGARTAWWTRRAAIARIGLLADFIAHICCSLGSQAGSATIDKCFLGVYLLARARERFRMFYVRAQCLRAVVR